MTDGVLCFLASAVASFVFCVVAYPVVYRRGVRMGRALGHTAALVEMRDDLDKTVEEWRRRGDAGDTARVIELPGIMAVQRMLK